MYNPSARSVHNVVAPRYFTNIEFGFAGQLNSVAGAAFAIYGNSVWKPGATSGVAFPGTLYPATVGIADLKAVGTDLMNGLYSRYRVYESTISVMVFPSQGSASGGGACQLVVLPNTQESTLADIQLAQSLPYSKYKLCCIGAGGEQNTLTHTMDTRTICGASAAEMTANPNLSSGSNSVPNQPWWWTVIIASFDSGTSGKSFNVSVRCNYRVEYFDPTAEPDVS